VEEKVREIFNSHESEDVKIKRLAALMGQGCDGCNYDGLVRESAPCQDCVRLYAGMIDHYTPTEPKE